MEIYEGKFQLKWSARYRICCTKEARSVFGHFQSSYTLASSLILYYAMSRYLDGAFSIAIYWVQNLNSSASLNAYIKFCA